MVSNILLERRELLKKVATVGLVHSCGMLGMVQQVLAENTVNQGIVSASGEVTVNDRQVHKGTVIKPGQIVKTGENAEVIYVIGANAFLQHGTTEVHFGTNAIRNFMRVVTGRLLSVFGNGPKRILVPNASLGIRGTACHIGVEVDRTYLCLCYGELDLMLPTSQKEPISLKSSHHDHALYVPSHRNETIQPTLMQDHADSELKLLEALVGRLPTFMKG
ncbi:conserved hypothetical protein [Gammaproteobacteria bacterium]